MAVIASLKAMFVRVAMFMAVRMTVLVRVNEIAVPVLVRVCTCVCGCVCRCSWGMTVRLRMVVGFEPGNDGVAQPLKEKSVGRVCVCTGANARFWHKADIGQLNDLTGGGSFSVEARADAASPA
jgi:hypothetical protein